MTLDDYLKKHRITARDFATTSDVSYNTIKSVRKGMRLKLYEVAKKISDATQNLVTVHDLCEE